MERARNEKRYQDALDYASEAVAMLPQFVKDVKKEYGRWDVKHSPQLEYVCNRFAVLRRRDDLQHISTMLKSVPQLKEWASYTNVAMAKAELMDKVEALLFKNPGFIQDNLVMALGSNRSEISEIIDFAEEMGLIHREAEGETYRLYLLKNPQGQSAITDT
jgi:hypothetical protein